MKNTIENIAYALAFAACVLALALPVMGWQTNLARGMANDAAMAGALDAAVEIVRGWCHAR